MTLKSASVSRFSPPRGLCAVLLVMCALWGSIAFAGDVSTRKIPLSDEVSAVVDARADVVLMTDAGRVLLDIRAPRLELHRRRGAAEPTVFFLDTNEGAVGGHRGFSRSADDDGDDRVDEDRADGVDNDEDGFIDEDFAAVGDRMHVVHRSRGRRNLHLETYHWNYEHLSRILVLSWDAEGVENDDLLLSLDGAVWTAAAVGWADPRHSDLDLMNRTMAVTKLTDLSGEYWLGMSVLPTSAADPVLRLESTELRLHIAEGCDLAVCIAPTLSQLRSRMATAQRLSTGTHDAAAGDVVPWIVPTPRGFDPDAVLSARRLNREDGTVVLELDTPENWTRLPDPATLRLGGRLMAAPASVSWRPADELSSAEPWTERWPESASWRTEALAPHPYLDHRDRMESAEPAVWSFNYPDGLPDIETGDCTLQTLCGRDVSAPLEIIDFDVDVPEDQEKEDQDQDVLSLSPRLIEGYPNPFVDFLQVRFTVPETIGDGFDLEPSHPFYEKSADPIPYASSMPRARVTIYTLSGRAVATVFDEICGFGEYQTSWNCLDTQGRPVATGTYFCRLQIENWSVTKRVALLR